MTSSALQELSAVFPRLGFRYEPGARCFLGSTRNGDILVSAAGHRSTPTLKWEATYGEHDVLAESPVHAVRLLARRLNLSLEGA